MICCDGRLVFYSLTVQANTWVHLKMEVARFVCGCVAKSLACMLLVAIWISTSGLHLHPPLRSCFDDCENM